VLIPDKMHVLSILVAPRVRRRDELKLTLLTLITPIYGIHGVSEPCSCFMRRSQLGAYTYRAAIGDLSY